MTKRYALRPSSSVPIIYLYRDSIDFRNGHRGLSAIVQMELEHDPFSGILYVFRNRAFDKVKILFCENNGFVLYYKSLAEGKFHSPSANDQLLTINGEQHNWLIEGYDIARMKPHKVLLWFYYLISM
ncbi:MAG: transposase, partial [Granulosicoccus sp.]